MSKGKTARLEAVSKVVAGSAAYDAEAAELLSVIATWSYSSWETLGEILHRPSYGLDPEVDPRPFSVKNPALPIDANAFLISHRPGGKAEPLHILSFRGTEPTEVTDFLTDALIEQHPWSEGLESNPKEWVHRGFFLSLDVLWPELAGALSQLEGSLLITGHSLGGAIAALAARKVLDEGVAVRQGAKGAKGAKKGLVLRGVYTFGQPMVGGRVFAKQSVEVAELLYRHVFYDDLVPRLPPWSEGTPSDSRYEHFGALYLPRPGAGGPARWERLDDDQARRESEAATPEDILPAFTPLLTGRAPFLREDVAALRLLLRGLRGSVKALRRLCSLGHQGGCLPCAAGSIVAELFGDLAGAFRPPRFSVEDHFPTHYVDVSKASVGESSSITKRDSPR